MRLNGTDLYKKKKRGKGVLSFNSCACCAGVPPIVDGGSGGNSFIYRACVVMPYFGFPKMGTGSWFESSSPSGFSTGGIQWKGFPNSSPGFFQTLSYNYVGSSNYNSPTLGNRTGPPSFNFTISYKNFILSTSGVLNLGETTPILPYMDGSGSDYYNCTQNWTDNLLTKHADYYPYDGSGSVVLDSTLSLSDFVSISDIKNKAIQLLASADLYNNPVNPPPAPIGGIVDNGLYYEVFDEPKVLLGWNPVTNASSYKIYRAASYLTNLFTLIGTTSSNQFTDTAPPQDTPNNYYRITAIVGGIESAVSNTVQSTYLIPPLIPTGILPTQTFPPSTAPPSAAPPQGIVAISINTRINNGEMIFLFPIQNGGFAVSRKYGNPKGLSGTPFLFSTSYPPIPDQITASNVNPKPTSGKILFAANNATQLDFSIMSAQAIIYPLITETHFPLTSKWGGIGIYLSYIKSTAFGINSSQNFRSPVLPGTFWFVKYGLSGSAPAALTGLSTLYPNGPFLQLYYSTNQIDASPDDVPGDGLLYYVS